MDSISKKNDLESLNAINRFFRDNEHLEGHVFINNFLSFSWDQCNSALGGKLINELAEFENAGDSINYMRTLIQNKSKLDYMTTNFLYHRWIRIMVMKKYSDVEREIIKDIPIAFLVTQPTLEAYIVRLGQFHVICFTQSYNAILHELYKTIAKAEDENVFSYDDAAKRIINIARYLLGERTIDTLSDLHLDRKQIVSSDLLNNLLQMFTLSHEYNHYLLGHLEGDNQRPIMNPSMREMDVKAYDSNLNEELEADTKAVRILREQNNQKENILRNGYFFNSILLFFKFSRLCKLLQGFDDSGTSYVDIRLNHMKKEIFGNTDINVILKEGVILDIALDYAKTNKTGSFI